MFLLLLPHQTWNWNLKGSLFKQKFLTVSTFKLFISMGELFAKTLAKVLFVWFNDQIEIDTFAVFGAMQLSYRSLGNWETTTYSHVHSLKMITKMIWSVGCGWISEFPSNFINYHAKFEYQVAFINLTSESWAARLEYESVYLPQLGITDQSGLKLWVVMFILDFYWVHVNN